MTVAAYSAKHGVTEKAVYHAIYDGRLPRSYNGRQLDLPDIPFPENRRLRKASELSDLPDYILSLIWFTGSIVDDAILIRHQDQELHRIISTHLPGSVWSRENTTVTKIPGIAIVAQLREYGYSGKNNTARIPPPVEPLPLAKAYLETHTSFTRALIHDRHHPGKEYASYYPSISLCASAAIMETLSLALCYLGIAPIRRLSPAANGTSATIKYTSIAQLRDMHTILSVDLGSGTNAQFWERFDAHICTPPIPYTKGEQK